MRIKLVVLIELAKLHLLKLYYLFGSYYPGIICNLFRREKLYKLKITKYKNYVFLFLSNQQRHKRAQLDALVIFLNVSLRWIDEMCLVICNNNVKIQQKYPIWNPLSPKRWFKSVSLYLLLSLCEPINFVPVSFKFTENQYF